MHRGPERDHPLVGQIVGGKYKITKLIGTGGMAHVFEAQNTLLRRMVAIKLVDATATPDAVRRLEHEVLLVSAVQHPNICDVLDVGVMPDTSPFIVFERLYGETLDALFRRRGKLPTPLTFEIFSQLLSGLQAAHGAQIVHRDLKPANVFLVDRLGLPPLTKIVDFGFAKDISGLRTKPITRPGNIVGTMRYMSPEHLSGSKLDHRADIFAVGLMLFVAFTGRHPFDLSDRNAPDLERALHAAFLRERPDLAESVATVVTRALARNPAERFQSALDLQQRLVRTLDVEDRAPESLRPRVG